MSEEVSAKASGEVPLSVEWIGAEEATIHFANQALGQIVQRGEIVLTFGQAVPPILSGTPEQQVEQVRQISSIQAKTVARLVLTPERVRELVDILQVTLDNYYEIQREVDEVENK